MKVVLIVLLFTFLAISSGLGTSTRRFGKQISIHSLHLEKISSLGSALKGLIQLADVAELDPVLAIIKEISAEFNDLLKSNQKDLAVLTSTHDSDQAAAEESINNIQGSIDTAQASLDVANKAQDQLNDAISANNDAITAATQATDQETNRRQQASDANKKRTDSINAALQSLSEADEVLQGIRDSDLSASSSFIQVERKRFAKSLVLVQKKLSKVKLTSSPIEFYIKQLVQISQDAEASGSVNSDILDQIFVLVENFKQSLKDEAEQAKEDEDADEKNSEVTLALLADTIATQKAALTANQEQLAAIQSQIQVLDAQLANLEQNLSDAQSNLNAVNDNFAKQSEILEGYIARLQTDLEVLQKALVFVQTEASSVQPASDEKPSSALDEAVAQLTGSDAGASADAGAGADASASASDSGATASADASAAANGSDANASDAAAASDAGSSDESASY